MKRNGIAATVAAEIAISCRLRPRLVQLPPRTFYLLARTRNVSSTPNRPIACTAIQRAQSSVSASPKTPSIDEHAAEQETVLSGSTSDAQGGGSTAGENATEDSSNTQSAKEQQQFFINLMRHIPHPVAVITARNQDVEDDIQGTIAATVSSFNTVSVDPDLIVSFNLKANSSTYKTIVQSKYFTITFPQMNSLGADLVHSFTVGNNPPPLSVKHSKKPTPKPFYWIDRHSEELAKLKYHPPTVSLTEPSDVNNSGFAFAFTCEYQTSTFLGDHVIVSGRLTSTPIKTAGPGWGVSWGKTPFAERIVTLTHAHGTYSSAHSGFGFTNTLRTDETFSQRAVGGVDPHRMVGFCRRRLQVLALAQLSQKGVNIGKLNDTGHRGPIPQIVGKITEMEPDVLQEYERYYMQRLVYWELKVRKQVLVEPTSTTDETSSEVGTLNLATYAALAGHERMFIRNKMLLSHDDLDEEISLYEMRLSKLKVKTQQDPATLALDIDSESMDEHTPEEVEPDPNSITEGDAVSRDKQLIQYFRKRVHLLQQAKIQKAESSATNEPLDSRKSPREEVVALKRFRGTNKNESLHGLKTKYRRYQYQITEARLALLGLEEIPGGHKNVQILRDRVKFFTPRLAVIEECIKERAKSGTATEILADNFHLPPMRIPDEDGKMVKVTPEDEADNNSYLARSLIRPIVSKNTFRTYRVQDVEVPTKTGDSADQLDLPPEEEEQRMYKPGKAGNIQKTRDSVKQAGKKMPVEAGPNSKNRRTPFGKAPQLSPEEQEEREFMEMEEKQKETLRRSAREVRDFLVLQGPEGEDENMPSPDDFIDVKKMRNERIREEEEQKRG